MSEIDERAFNPLAALVNLDRRQFLTLSASASLAIALASNASAQQTTGQLPQPTWNPANIPSQTGRTVVITGGNGIPSDVTEGAFPPPGHYSGLGYQDALALAGKGANVIIASRNSQKGQAAVDLIKAQHPGANIRFEQFDLSDLDSVKAFSDRLHSQVDRIDLLINNAATAGTPDRRVNKAGLELCWATNLVGHYSLTAQLFPLLQKGDASRVVFVSSGAARRAKLSFDDTQTEREYTPLKAYALSKAAILVLARELNRRSIDSKWGIEVIPVHPGTAKTYLIPDGPGPDSDFGRGLASDPGRFRPTELGVLSSLFAATDPTAEGGTYYGPVDDAYNVGVSEDHAPGVTPELAARLYDELVKTTGLPFA